MIAAPKHRNGIIGYQNVDVLTHHVHSCMCLKNKPCAYAPDNLGTRKISQASVLMHVGIDKQP